jgi:hypothetical protein
MNKTLIFLLFAAWNQLGATTINYAAAANGATATASSTYQLDFNTFGPQNAIDGLITPTDYANANTNYKFFSSWTGMPTPHVFEVTFAGESYIQTINLFNRSNCCASRLTNFSISLLDGGNTPVWSNNYFTNGGFPNLLLTASNINQMANKLKVEFLAGARIPGEDYMHFDEIQALGDVPEPGTLALGGLGLLCCFYARHRNQRGSVSSCDSEVKRR